jgi:hypothetical protein
LVPQEISSQGFRFRDFPKVAPSEIWSPKRVELIIVYIYSFFKITPTGDCGGIVGQDKNISYSGEVLGRKHTIL